MDKHLRLPAVKEATGLGRTSIYDMMKEGSFPKPVNIGKRAVAWPESVIQKWMDERAEASA